MSRSQKSSPKRKLSRALTPLGEALLSHMKQTDLTAQAAASAIGISQSYFSELIRGKFEPSFEVREAIAQFLNIPATQVERLARGILIQDIGKLDAGLEFGEMLDKDPILRDMYNAYQGLKSEAEKRAMLKAIKVFVVDAVESKR